MSAKHKVILRRCDDYRPDRIAGIVREGMEELGVVPGGRILLKPNTVIARRGLFPHAFTRKEFLDGVIAAVKTRSRDAEEIAVGERSGITIPTRFCFKEAGYPEVFKKHKIKVHYFDECNHLPVRLTREGRLRDEIFVPKPVIRTDFLINLPKFKSHPWTRLTLSLKNYIGLQDDRHRLVDHNSLLEFKIADLQEVIESRFIAVDAVIAGEKTMLSPESFHMGAIVMGTNSCAVDTVGCHIVHLNPSDLVHLRLASERGFGPSRLDDIEITGDLPLEKIQAKTGNFRFLFERIDDYFGKESSITCNVGTFPEEHSRDYCWGGCPGALQEAVHILKAYAPDADKRMKKIRYVVGDVKNPIKPEKGERVVFVGDCTAWEGRLNGKKIHIQRRYGSRDESDSRKTKSNDLLLKIIRSFWRCLKPGASKYVRSPGCPVSVAEHVNILSLLGRTRNPYFDPKGVIPVGLAYIRMRLGRLINRLLG